MRICVIEGRHVEAPEHAIAYKREDVFGRAHWVYLEEELEELQRYAADSVEPVCDLSHLEVDPFGLMATQLVD